MLAESQSGGDIEGGEEEFWSAAPLSVSVGGRERLSFSLSLGLVVDYKCASLFLCCSSSSSSSEKRGVRARWGVESSPGGAFAGVAAPLPVVVEVCRLTAGGDKTGLAAGGRGGGIRVDSCRPPPLVARGEADSLLVGREYEPREREIERQSVYVCACVCIYVYACTVLLERRAAAQG